MPRLSLRKLVLSCLLITLIVVLDVIHRSLRRELQHSDTLRLQRRIHQRYVSSSELLQNGTQGSNSTKYQHGDQTVQNEAIKIVHKAIEYEKKRNSTLDDVFISVKTTKKFHESRVSLQLETWFNLAREQVSFSSIYFYRRRGKVMFSEGLSFWPGGVPTRLTV